MKKILLICVVVSVAALLFYLSRFWTFSLWPRSGLLGIEALRPQGDLIRRWVRGTQAAPFAIMIWAIGCFAVLTFGQKLHDAVVKRLSDKS